MVVVKCQHSGIEFEANSKRAKQHPDVASFKNEAASKRGDYSLALQALDKAREIGGYETIDEYMQLVNDIYAGAYQDRRQAEQKRLQLEAKGKQEMADRKAKRQTENEYLKANGYTWKKEEIFDHDQMEEYDPRYAKFEWTLYAPDGRPVSKEQALNEIEHGSDKVIQELVKIIENGEKLPYNIILTGKTLEADNRRKQAEKDIKEGKAQAWEAAKNEVKNRMAEVEPFDYSGFEVVYAYKAYDQHTGRIYQGQINGVDCIVIYSYHGGHDFYQTEQYYSLDPEQAKLNRLPEHSSLEASWRKFFGE